MPRFRNLLARLAARPRPLNANAPKAMNEPKCKNDVFAELIAASSFLDFGGVPMELKLKETDLDCELRPW